MKLGLDSYSVRNSGLNPIGVLKLAGDWGLSGVLFELSPFKSFRDADLAAIRRFGEERGLYVHLGMGSIFHWHPMATQGRELLAEAGYETNVPEARTVIQHLEVARKLGSPILRCVGGTLSPATRATTWRPWLTRRWPFSARPARRPRTWA